MALASDRRASHAWSVRAAIFFAVLAVLAVLAALGVIAPRRAEAADDPLVKAVAVPEQELRDDGAHPVYTFPLTLADGVDAASLRAYVVRVTARGKADPGLIPAFKPEVKTAEMPEPALVMTVDFALASAPTTYEIEVGLTGKKGSAPAKGSVTVRLTHPAAQLRGNGKLLISRSWLLGQLGLYPSTLSVEETSGRTQLSGLAIAEVRPALHDDEPVEGNLAFVAPPALAPGATVAVPLSLAGTFPVGITHGKVEIRAPQLEAPQVIEYELRMRLPAWMIPIMFLTGAGLGYFIRVWLKNREQRLARELKVRETIERLRALEERSVPGEQAQKDLHDAMKELEDHVESADESAKAIAKAEEVYAGLVEARAKEQREMLADAAHALAVLGRGWELPRAVDRAPVKKAFEEVQRCAAKDDLLGVRIARGDTVEGIHALARASRGWASAIERQLAKLEDVKLPPRVEIAPSLAELRAALAKIPVGDTDPGLEPLLQAVHGANTSALALVERAANALAAAADEAARAVTEKDHAQALREAVGMLETPMADADEGLGRLTDAARGLHEAMGKVMAGLMPPAEADRRAVQSLLDERRYAEALTKAEDMAAKANAGPMMYSEPGDDVEPAAPPQGKPRPFLSLFTRGPEPRAGGEMSVIVMAAAPALPDRATVARQLGQTRAVLGVLAALIMAMLTWALYGKQFFGTPPELLSLFALGFTTDVSADALFAALDKAKKAG